MKEAQPVSRREKNKARVRASILDAARAGFGRAGVDGITMNEIAADAEVSRATLFKYFSNKNEILEVIIDQMNSVFFARIDRCCSETEDPAIRVYGVFTETGAGVEEAGAMSRRFVGIIGLNWSDQRESEAMSRFRAAFYKMLDSGRLQGHADLDFLVDLAIGIFMGLLQNWRTIEGFPLRIRMAQAANEIAEIVARRIDRT